MQILTTGKNLDIGGALREHIEDRMREGVGKYFDRAVRSHVVVEKQRSAFYTECTVSLATGLVLSAHGKGVDAHASFDMASGHLEKQLRRYKQRLKNHHQNREEPVRSVASSNYIIVSDLNEEDTSKDEPDTINPTIVAETVGSIPELSVGEAVLQLEISNTPFVLFTNKGSGSFNVVYRRHDGHIGWVEPKGA